MRPIDADALHKAYMELRNFKQDPQSGDWISLRAVPLTTVIRMLNEAPTIEPKRGEWMPNPKIGWGETWVCSICGEKTTSSVMGYPRYNYCPMCGAKMDGERKESE